LGLRDASMEFGMPILGGDVNEADELVIDVAMVGFVKKMVRRDGAKTGDVLVATGPFGLTALGLRHLLDGKQLPEPLAAASLRSVYQPSPRKDVCPLLIGSGLVDSSMDSSDGLAITLNEMARQSRKEIIMTSLPTDESFIRACSSSGLDPLDLVLHGGEEYEAILAIPKAKLRRATELAEKAGARLYPFGYVGRGGAQVTYLPPGGLRAATVEAEGWVHLE